MQAIYGNGWTDIFRSFWVLYSTFSQVALYVRIVLLSHLLFFVAFCFSAFVSMVESRAAHTPAAVTGTLGGILNSGEYANGLALIESCIPSPIFVVAYPQWTFDTLNVWRF